MVDEYPCCDDFSLEIPKEETTSIFFLELREEYLIIRFTIMSKSISRSRVSKERHPGVDIFSRGLYPLCSHATFFCKSDIVSSFLMHLLEYITFTLHEIDDSRPWFEEVFIGSMYLRSPQDSGHFDAMG